MAPDLHLSPDQEKRMQAIHSQFKQQLEANEKTFNIRIESLLTSSQKAVFDKMLADRAAFERGAESARQALNEKDVVPLLPPFMAPRPEPVGLPREGMGPIGEPGMPPPMRAGLPPHLAALKLTPEQAGAVSVYFRAFDMKQHQDMQAMMEQMRQVLSPEQQRRMPPPGPPRREGDHPDDGPPPPPPRSPS
jgi:hypothetical protein